MHANLNRNPTLKITIAGARKKNSNLSSNVVEFDFNALQVRPGGLLESVLSSFPEPIDMVYLNIFNSVLRLLKTDTKAITILSKKTDQLESVDIHTLFRIAEGLISKHLVETGRYKNGSRPSLMFRRCMKYLTTPLKDGAYIEDVKFKTIFKSSQDNRIVISELHDKGCDDPVLASPVSQIIADSAEELHAKALHHFQVRNERIANACLSIISSYAAFKENLTELINCELPDLLDDCILDYKLESQNTHSALTKVSPEILLHFFIHYYERYNLHNFKNYNNWCDTVRLPAFIKSIKSLDIADELCMYTLGASDLLSRLVLCRHYAPSVVVVSARNLMQLETSWNVDTCNSISLASISHTSDGLHINAIKNKTSQETNIHLSKSFLENSNMVKIIELLSENRKSLNDSWSSNTESIFAAPTLAVARHLKEAECINAATIQNNICDKFNLPRFTSEQLRDQSLNTHYLATDDIYSVQSIAGWSNLDTAIDYLNQTIVRVLSDANINNFMKKLQNSIVWATDAIKSPEHYGFDLHEVDKKLLFPIQSNVTNSSSVVDDWLNNDLTDIVITNDRMKHTANQMNYYNNNWEKLLSNNEKGFLVNHLPRVLFCVSLDRVIKESEHAEEYKLICEQLHG